MNTSHYPNLDLCKKLTEAGFPTTEMVFYSKDGGNPFGPTRRTKVEDDYMDEIIQCPSVMELLDFIRTNNISLLGNGVINFLSPELPDALAELVID